MRSGIDSAVRRPRRPTAGRPVRPRQRTLVRLDADPGGPRPYRRLRPAARAAEADVRAIIEEAAAASPEAGSVAAKVGDLYASFMDEAAVEARGAAPLAEDLADIRAVGTADDVVAARAASQGQARGLRRPVRQHRRPRLQPLHRLPRAGRPRASRRVLLPPGGARGESARTTSRHVAADAAPGRVGRADRRGRAGHGARDRDRRRATGQRGQPRPGRDLQPRRPRGARSPGARVDWDGIYGGLGAPDEHARRARGAPARLPAAPSPRCSPSSPSRSGGTGWRGTSCDNHAPYLSSAFVDANFDFYGRTLSGVPELRDRWKRGVGLVEGCARRGRRQALRRRALPAGRQGADGRAGREPRRGAIAAAPRASSTWMAPETRREAHDEARGVHAEDRLPRPLARLLGARRSRPTTWSATSGAPRVRGRPPPRASSASRSTATSGS